jgi:hypothetical protein
MTKPEIVAALRKEMAANGEWLMRVRGYAIDTYVNKKFEPDSAQHLCEGGINQFLDDHEIPDMDADQDEIDAWLADGYTLAADTAAGKKADLARLLKRIRERFTLQQESIRREIEGLDEDGEITRPRAADFLRVMGLAPLPPARWTVTVSGVECDGVPRDIEAKVQENFGKMVRVDCERE